MKHLIIFILFCVQTSLYSQTNLKFNLLTALVAAPNLGIETKIGSKTTFQIDALASYWKSFNGGPQQFLIVIPEIRYYTKTAFDGFFIGAHFGGSVYKLQKLNYFNTDRYQKGFNYLIGATIGYQYKINDKYSAEMFIGGGDRKSVV